MRETVSRSRRGWIGPQLELEIQGNAFGVTFGNEFSQALVSVVILRLRASRRLQHVYRVVDDVVGSEFFDPSGVPGYPPSFAGLGVSPATSENGTFYPVSTPVRKDEDTGGCSQVFRTKGILDGLPHYVNPHVDIVPPHDFRKDDVELLPTDPMVPFRQVFLVLCNCLRSAETKGNKNRHKQNDSMRHHSLLGAVWCRQPEQEPHWPREGSTSLPGSQDAVSLDPGCVHAEGSLGQVGFDLKRETDPARWRRYARCYCRRRCATGCRRK